METSYSTPQTDNPVLNPRIYWRVSAFALTAVALLGIILNSIGQGDLLGRGFLAFDWTHNILHVVLAAVAFVFGFAPVPGTISKVFAITFGVVYVTLGILGFVLFGTGANVDATILGLHLETGENLVHLLLGAWALTAGIAARY